MTRRIFASIIIFLSIIFLPYWIYLPMLLAAVAVFPIFWEGILLALLADVVYGGAFVNFDDVLSSFGFYTLLVIILFLPLRERLRYHA